MKRFLALSVILGVSSFGMIGCGGEEGAKPEEKPADVAAPAAPGEAPKEGAPAEAAPGAPAEAPKDAAPAPAPAEPAK